MPATAFACDGARHRAAHRRVPAICGGAGRPAAFGVRRCRSRTGASTSSGSRRQASGDARSADRGHRGARRAGSRPVTLHGALAASVTPLREHGASSTTTRSGRSATSTSRRARRRPRARHGGEGILLASRSGVGSQISSSRRRQSAADRRPLRRADDRGHGRAGGACRRGGSRCGRRHRPAVLQARREGPVRSLLRRRDRVRAAAVLRLRVRGDDRLCRSRLPCSSACATPPRTSSASRCRTRR